MVIVFIIVILISLSAGGYFGYRIGTHYVSQENDTLRNQLMLQERFSRTWAAEATDKYTLSNHVATQQVTNVRDTMQMVVHLLGRVEQQEANAIDNEQREKIDRIIQQARSFTNP